MSEELRGEHYAESCNVLNTVSVGFSAEHWEMFQCIRRHYGMQTNASVLRLLLVQKYRALQRHERRGEQ